jgi:putative membrane protein
MLDPVSSDEQTLPSRARFPRRVFDVGSEPEIRDSLANERTFLAWVRTGLALVAGSVAVASPVLEFDPGVRLMLSLGLLLAAAVAVGVGWSRWQRTEISLRTRTRAPGFLGGLVFLGTVGLLLLGAFAAALLHM